MVEGGPHRSDRGGGRLLHQPMSRIGGNRPGHNGGHEANIVRHGRAIWNFTHIRFTNCGCMESRSSAVPFAADMTSIYDLKNDPVAKLDHPSYAIFFYLPRVALDLIACHGMRIVDELLHPRFQNFDRRAPASLVDAATYRQSEGLVTQLRPHAECNRAGLWLRRPKSLYNGVYEDGRLQFWRVETFAQAGGYFSASAAFSTSSAWPGTFTFRQMPRITPLSSIRKVERSTPMYFFPYMLFSTQVP